MNHHICGTEELPHKLESKIAAPCAEPLWAIRCRLGCGRATARARPGTLFDRPVDQIPGHRHPDPGRLDYTRVVRRCDQHDARWSAERLGDEGWRRGMAGSCEFGRACTSYSLRVSRARRPGHCIVRQQPYKGSLSQKFLGPAAISADWHRRGFAHLGDHRRWYRGRSSVGRP